MGFQYDYTFKIQAVNNLCLKSQFLYTRLVMATYYPTIGLDPNSKAKLATGQGFMRS